MRTSSRMRRVVASTAAVAVVALGLTVGTPAAAAPLDPFDTTFPAGQVCPFPLRVEGVGADQVSHTFPGHHGDSITVESGRGFDLTFTNTDTQAQFELPARFSAKTTVTHPNGPMTVYLVGWNVLFLFPTDTPAGPSTTLHVGVLVYDDDGNANFTVDQRRTHSRTTDICAAVS